MSDRPDRSTLPFLKWPGGKRWAAAEIANLVRNSLRRKYYEPFLGGGSVFFELAVEDAQLSDINADLINTYVQVRDDPNRLLNRLRRKKVSKENYYRIRKQNPGESMDGAVRFLFLNRTCFGGLYRVNKAGQFNVPYGGGERTLRALWSDKLIANASKTLEKASLKVRHFETILKIAGRGDVVYCDPTYTVTHENNGFVRYNESNFSWADQVNLRRQAERAASRGAAVIVSNAWHSSIFELYQPYNPIRLSRNSQICPDSSKRRSVDEALFEILPKRKHHSATKKRLRRQPSEVPRI